MVVKRGFIDSSPRKKSKSIHPTYGEYNLLSRLGFLTLLNQWYLLLFPIRSELRCSVWRPLVPVVKDCPLAFCDRRSVPKQDLVEIDKVHEDHWEGGYLIKYNPDHRWYWLPNQTSNEVSVFLTWDSDHEAFESACKQIHSRVRHALKLADVFQATPPHAAFRLPVQKGDCQPRESVEVRLMVFTRRIVGRVNSP